MKSIRARFVVTLKSSALVCAVWLLSATCAVASPITVGHFEFDPDPFGTGAGPRFTVDNISEFPGLAVTFGDLHLVFDLLDQSTMEFSLAEALGPKDFRYSDTLTDDLGNSRLPDLASVLDAYLTMTILDPVTLMALAGTTSFGPVPRMTDFLAASMVTIQFEPTPVPEPASLLLVGSGLAAGAITRRRRERATVPRSPSRLP